MKERQDQFGEVVGAAVVGVVGARNHRQLTQREQPGSGLCPGHGHDRRGAAPRDQRRRPDQGSLSSIGSRRAWASVPTTRRGPASCTSRTRMGSCNGSSRAVSPSQRRIWRGAVRAVGSIVGPTRTRPPTRSGWRMARSTATWQPKELPSTATAGNPAAWSQAANGHGSRLLGPSANGSGTPACAGSACRQPIPAPGRTEGGRRSGHPVLRNRKAARGPSAVLLKCFDV
jgi:hypothetical protein